jgi:mutator family transposase
MARTMKRMPGTLERTLEPVATVCAVCAQPTWIAYHGHRRLVTLAGIIDLRLKIRRCRNPACSLFTCAIRPEGEGALALPHGEVGLDVIALIGALRYAEHRSVPEIHRELTHRRVAIAERTVTNLLQRYEELVALKLQDDAGLQDTLRQQGRVVLALDGLQPDVGHEVLWVLRDCLSGAVLLARSLLGGTQDELAALLREVETALPVPIRGVISDGQPSIRRAVKAALPAVRHQLCQFHYLREAARPVYEADRHAKKELKKQVRGIRPIERALEGRTDAEAEAVRGYCLAVRSALTDDGRPPLCASGLKLQQRLTTIHDSIGRVAEKRGCRRN